MIFQWIQAQAIKLLAGALLIAIAAIPINGCIEYRQGFRNGAESVKAELRAERAAAVERSLEAAVEADAAGIERAEVEAETVEAIIERIEEAETNDENALDALFGK